MTRQPTAALLLSLVTLAGLPTVNAQNVLPFPPEGEHLFWKYSFTGGMLLNAYNQYEYDGEHVELDGQVYKVIRRSHRYEVHTGPGSMYVDEGYHDAYCYLRTDNEGVSYMHSTEFPPEEVLFDPSIGVGDTVPTTWKLIRRDWYNYTVTVAAIDTMIDNQGVPRRVWHFETPYNAGALTFIEGIGCTQEFLGIPYTLGGPQSALVCANYDGASVYGPACVSLSVGVDEPGLPAWEELRVTVVPGTSIYQLNRASTAAVFDPLGRAVAGISAGTEFNMVGNGGGLYILRTDAGELIRFFHTRP